ncbi:hypothetical protein VKT23_009958 [Stygiomarasmius scandens]|uniref:Uncharacterized protein n=1 Tax=Marasmiellus scandens TaxID=2682957 RepID=A0ABR1JCM2_9AGAR
MQFVVFILATSLLKRLIEALDGKEKHTQAFKLLTAALPSEEVEKWQKAVTDWEHDPNANPNPFETTTKGISLDKIQLQLAEEDKSLSKDDRIHSVSAKSMLLRGIALEQEQIQIVEAHDALDSLRRHLVLKTSVWQFRNANVFGQRMMTRSQQVISDVMDKINRDAACYRRAFQAIKALSKVTLDDSWKGSLRMLKTSDIRSFQDIHDTDGKGHAPKRLSAKKRKQNFVPQGKQTYLWIWLSVCTEGPRQENQLDRALAIKWCKARARAFRFQEECILLQEEMRRTRAFYWWQQQLWKRREDYFSGSELMNSLPDDVIGGGLAYACQQADVYKRWKQLPNWLKNHAKELEAEESEYEHDESGDDGNDNNRDGDEDEAMQI